MAPEEDGMGWAQPKPDADHRDYRVNLRLMAVTITMVVHYYSAKSEAAAAAAAAAVKAPPVVSDADLQKQIEQSSPL